MKGIKVLDVTLIVNDVIRSMSKNRELRSFLNLDIEKAYGDALDEGFWCQLDWVDEVVCLHS